MAGEAWWVPGVPATFATSRERAWKQSLAEHVPPCSKPHSGGGICLDLHLVGVREGAHAQDLDNAAEPVLSVIINKLGWFGGRRPNLKWLAIRKGYDRTPGCEIVVAECPPPDWFPNGRPIFSEIYNGAIPSSAQSAEIPAWLQALQAPAPSSLARYGLSLEFGGPVNLGDIPTGRIKRIIDCMWPLWGGTAKAPEDWRVYQLLAWRGDLEPTAVAISVWRL